MISCSLCNPQVDPSNQAQSACLWMLDVLLITKRKRNAILLSYFRRNPLEGFYILIIVHLGSHKNPFKIAQDFFVFS